MKCSFFAALIFQSISYILCLQKLLLSGNNVSFVFQWPSAQGVYNRLYPKSLNSFWTYRRKNTCQVITFYQKTQSDLRTEFTCSTILLNFLDNIQSDINSGSLFVLILLDYWRTFDTINNSLLQAIIKFIGFPQAILLFWRFLENRFQYIETAAGSSSGRCNFVPNIFLNLLTKPS